MLGVTEPVLGTESCLCQRTPQRRGQCMLSVLLPLLPGRRRPLLRYHSNSDEVVAGASSHHLPNTLQDVQQELCIPDPISFLVWLHPASLVKEQIVWAILGTREVREISALGGSCGTGGWTACTPRGGAGLGQEKVTIQPCSVSTDPAGLSFLLLKMLLIVWYYDIMGFAVRKGRNFLLC